MDIMTILDEMATDLQKRLDATHNRSDVSELKGADCKDIIEVSCSYVLIGIRRSSTMAAMIADIGHKIRTTMGFERDSTKAARVGAFVLEAFANQGIIDVEEQPAKSGHTAYHVVSNDEEALTELWEVVPNDKSEHVPFSKKQGDWRSGFHASGLPIARHAPKSVLNSFNYDEHKHVMDALNKLQAQAWEVDAQMLKWYVSATNSKEKSTYIDEDGKCHYAFDFLDPDTDRKARSSMKMEANSVKVIAKKVVDRKFYHIYNCDFRGRIYPNTAFLHEQGSDRAKSLLRLHEKKPLGISGFRWLRIHASNSWGNDKVTLDRRSDFAWDNLMEWISYADAPFVNKGWMAADSCWSFLACCLELKKIVEWMGDGNDERDFLTNLPIFIDGSNNGVQHLTAMSLDETVAPLVNLVPQDLPGDVYMHVADEAWKIVEADYNPTLDDRYHEIFDAMREARKVFETRLNKEQRVAATKHSKDTRESFGDDIKAVTANYWHAVDNKKQRRKVTKRPVMTLGYGGTKFGFKGQILEDTKAISSHFRYMEYTWAIYMGSLIYDVCRGNEDRGIAAALPGPAKMLELFETLAERSVDQDSKFRWNVPVTNFPVVQQYRKPDTKRVWIDFCGKKMRLNIKIMENQSIKKSKQKTAASPNVVHSFDAAHLTMTVNACNFPIATVHDSFGCLAGDMEDLFAIVRETFVEFYDQDPLEQLLRAQNSLDLMPERGSLNVADIQDSDYAFV